MADRAPAASWGYAGVGVCVEGGRREASLAAESGEHTPLHRLCMSGVPFPEHSRLNAFTSASHWGSAQHRGRHHWPASGQDLDSLSHHVVCQPRCASAAPVQLLLSRETS